MAKKDGRAAESSGGSGRKLGSSIQSVRRGEENRERQARRQKCDEARTSDVHLWPSS